MNAGRRNELRWVLLGASVALFFIGYAVNVASVDSPSSRVGTMCLLLSFVTFTIGFTLLINKGHPLAFLGMAVAGAWMWAIGCGPFLLTRSSHPGPSPCLSETKQIGVGLQLYAQDYSDRFPANRWMDGLSEYSRYEEVFRCPAVTWGFGRAMSLTTLGKEESVLDPNRILVFESSDWSRNAADALSTFQARHKGKGAAVRVDTSVKNFTPESFGAMK